MTTRAKENHMVMEDKWEPITMGPTITGSMLETCTEKAVRRGASGRQAGRTRWVLPSPSVVPGRLP